MILEMNENDGKKTQRKALRGARIGMSRAGRGRAKAGHERRWKGAPEPDKHALPVKAEGKRRKITF